MDDAENSIKAVTVPNNLLENKTDFYLILPQDALFEIFKILESSDLFSLSRVSKKYFISTAQYLVKLNFSDINRDNLENILNGYFKWGFNDIFSYQKIDLMPKKLARLPIPTSNIKALSYISRFHEHQLFADIKQLNIKANQLNKRVEKISAFVLSMIILACASGLTYIYFKSPTGISIPELITSLILMLTVCISLLSLFPIALNRLYLKNDILLAPSVARYQLKNNAIPLIEDVKNRTKAFINNPNNPENVQDYYGTFFSQKPEKEIDEAEMPDDIESASLLHNHSTSAIIKSEDLDSFSSSSQKSVVGKSYSIMDTQKWLTWFKNETPKVPATKEQEAKKDSILDFSS